MRAISRSVPSVVSLMLALCVAPMATAQTPLHSIPGNAYGIQFGWSIASGADVDGDGVDDYVVGSPHDSLAGSTAGACRVYSGASGTLIHQFLGPVIEDHGGWSVSLLEDIDGDGRAEVIMGIPFNDQVASVAGMVRVYSGLTGSIIHTFLGGSMDDRTGLSVAGLGLGDVDGDGVSDFVVGSPRVDFPPFVTNGGRVDILSGATGLPIRVIAPMTPWEYFGHAVAIVGDLNGDGIGELAVGAPLASTSGLNSGNVRVYDLAPATPVLLFTVSPGIQADYLGRSVAGVGDLNGDLIPDFVAGAPHERPLYGPIPQPTPATPGSAWAFSGADGAILHTFTGDNPGDFLGYSVSGVSDTTGDGVPDILVGAPWANAGASPNRGYARLYSGATGAVVKTFWGAADGAFTGYGVGGLQDVTQDGLGECIIGSIQYLPATPTVWGNGLVEVYAGEPAISASITTLGPGCSSAPPTPVLAVTTPLLGMDTTISISTGNPGDTGILFVSAPGALPLSLPGGCDVYLDFFTITSLLPIALDGGGFWSLVAPIPGDPALSGLEFVLQALLIPGSGPSGFELSNGIGGTFGS